MGSHPWGSFRTAVAGCVCAACCAATISTAYAQSAGVLDGTIVAAGKPVPSAYVVASGNNVIVATRSDKRGRFEFTTLQPGSYRVTASTENRHASVNVALPASGATITIDVGLGTVGSVLSRATHPPVHGSGTDLTLTGETIARFAAGTSLPDLLVQLPGAARGANGVVHINGDHGDIDYVVDGVPVPQELNRVVGTEFDLSNAAFVDVMQGAYPAQYGGRFASVINIATRAGTAIPGYNASFSAGTFGGQETDAAYNTPAGKAQIVLALHAEATARGLDPPDFGAPVRDRAGDANEFARITLRTNATDYFNLDLANSLQTFQIPNDVANGEPASTDDVETQSDAFASLQYHHAERSGALVAALSFKRSRIRDFGDPANDFIYGQALYAASGGSPGDCANAMTTGTFGPATCAYSLNGDRTAQDGTFLTSCSLQKGSHALQAGASYDVTLVDKTYGITLQPGNFLAPIYTPSLQNSPYAVVDDSPNAGHTESTYVQDTWTAAEGWELQYGLREDAFQLFSNEFSDGASELSPRIKLTRYIGGRSAVYAYYGRFFTPFSFENVSPEAAYLLNLPLQRSVTAFDLKPQRDSDYELGGHLPLGRGDLGLRIMQKNATDLIDDTQVGVTALHQDINYQLGRIAVQSAYYQQALPLDGRFYASVNHTYSVNKGCETQLLAPCFGSPADWTPADHEQRWGATSGIILNAARGGWFSAAAEYGSGLSSSACAPGVAVCKYTPHLVFDVEDGVRMNSRMTLVVRLENVLNDRYFITYENAQGNHVAASRSLAIELHYSGARKQ